MDDDVVPVWLKQLVVEEFFNPCLNHLNEKKNEENRFCLDCSTSLCAHCVSSSHHSHHLLQIKRYMYRDVLGLNDAAKLFDCSFVQSYTVNGAKVVFLKHKVELIVGKQAGKGSTSSNNMCIVCERSLSNSFLFCSISCKVQHIIKECGQGKHCSNPESCTTSRSMCGAAAADRKIKDEQRTIATCSTLPSEMSSCCLTSELVKKKPSHRVRHCLPPTTSTTITEITTPININMRRRKNAPHRSPLY